MHKTTRALYLTVGGISLCLMGIIAVELDLAAPQVAAAPNEAPQVQAAPPAEPAAAPDLDALVSEILARPLFSPGRHPVEPPEDASDGDDEPTPKSAPELTGRLAGVMLGPDDDREALFAREGEKPLAVKEGDEVDGWTVSSIEADRVVLKSEFGEKIVEPTAGTPGEGQSHVPAAPKRRPVPNAPRPGVGGAAAMQNMPQQPGFPPRPGIPGMPQRPGGPQTMPQRPPPPSAAFAPGRKVPVTASTVRQGQKQ